MRFPLALLSALLVSLGLFWVMQWLVAPPQGDREARPDKAKVRVTRMTEPPEPQSKQAAGGGGSSVPPEPPPVPGLSRPSGIPIPAPKTDANTVLPQMDFKPELSSKTGLGESFGGMAAGGSGGGFGGGEGSGSGRGSGPGSGGRDLVPLSTARPQIPESACRQGIEGWAIAEFNVTPRGKVTNIRIVDAQPRGVFEQAMVESLQYWLYEASDEDKAYRVTWKFEFKLDDCKLNWR